MWTVMGLLLSSSEGGSLGVGANVLHGGAVDAGSALVLYAGTVLQYV